MIELSQENCDGCGVCVENCPVSILRVSDGRVRITKPELCTHCELCREVCHKRTSGSK